MLICAQCAWFCFSSTETISKDSVSSPVTGANRRFGLGLPNPCRCRVQRSLAATISGPNPVDPLFSTCRALHLPPKLSSLIVEDLEGVWAIDYSVCMCVCVSFCYTQVLLCLPTLLT